MSRPIDPKRIPSSRLERALGFGGLALKLGANVARSAVSDLAKGQRPHGRSLVLTPKNFDNIAHSLAQMRGAAMKLGQIISMDDTLLPPELSEILARLRAQGYAMPPKQLRQVLNAAWGDGWRSMFQHFDVRPFAAASIGQVHKATLQNGQRVAVKVQFPNIKSSIKSDIKNLRLLARASGMVPEGVDLDYYLEVCEQQLTDETDYKREAHYLRHFSDLTKEITGLQAPPVIEALSNETVLTMSFETGYTLDQLERFSQKDRQNIAQTLVDFTLRELFDVHMIQSDPNFANYLFDPKTEEVKLLDFGATIELPAKITAIYEKLLAHIMDNNLEGVFETLLEEHLMPANMPEGPRRLLRDVLTIALAEFHKHPLFSFSESAVFDYINPETIQEMSQVIPTDVIPAELLLTQRKLIGLVFLLRRLEARLPLKEMISVHLQRPTDGHWSARAAQAS